jgi:hypothetical protein
VALDRFIITGQPSVLKPLLDLLERDPETAVHTVARGDQDVPERLVISTDPERAAAIKTALGSLILMDPDDPLDL